MLFSLFVGSIVSRRRRRRGLLDRVSSIHVVRDGLVRGSRSAIVAIHVTVAIIRAVVVDQGEGFGAEVVVVVIDERAVV